ncbi:cytochrome c oxidase assembly protein subunit 19 [Marchantia polymorpha subsp. ruderalis]|uniref:CHCH domain-containing protein n=1 Tax=Marchantia polymorpha TaxID=3197 RepID=A0A2R6WM18_MARPO|nr:hypothetical protein MARPO_0075s0024 [Marchantia polymorpha]BBN00847.1 hypothetical protein Mp_2g02620 [Marchantia polymorpha subsp. ruderalis]|eukprot:PTQ34900.1 hypothetical protein MARPO_0075s0024 [Marchantia polymorpha]
MASIGGAFGGNRGLTPIPPEKGVFPLDHLHECDAAMKDYMKCLKESKFDSEKCRQLSKVYLECRMERGLMAKQDLKELGFKEGDGGRVEAEVLGGSGTPLVNEHSKLRDGFVSGIRKTSSGSTR